MDTDRAPPPAALVALAGLLALAVAMGVGRFAFTPLLPLMARAGQLDTAQGGWIAAANYVGYLAGALSAARWPFGPRALGAAALGATAFLTAAMAGPGFVLWLVLRLLAGVASAWCFVATSVWCLGALARQGRADLGGWVYAGVGTGIALAGTWCLVAGAAGVGASPLWLQLAGLAAVLGLPVLLLLVRLGAAPPSPATASAPGVRPGGLPPGTRGLVACYGIMGFGYILPATYLPVLARQVVDDPRLFGLAWPVFGATAALSTLAAAAWLRRASRLRVWTVSQAAMGVGVLLPSLWHAGWSIALSALLVGGTFMVVTLVGVQEMRARAAGDPTALVGRITAAFAAGQIAGPVLSSLLLRVPALAAHGLDLALQLGAAALLLSAAWLWRRSSSPIHSTQEIAHAR